MLTRLNEQIKQYQLMGGVSHQFGRMYGDAIDSAHKYLIRPIDVVPGRTGLTTIGAMVRLSPVLRELSRILILDSQTWGTWSSKLEHLTCFAGGMLGLGSKLLRREYDMGAALNVRTLHHQISDLYLLTAHVLRSPKHAPGLTSRARRASDPSR